jgi:hypothetical protein
MYTHTQMVVNFTSIDGTQFRMFPAERRAHIQGDTKPNTIAGKFALELFCFAGQTAPRSSKPTLLKFA